jgi:hypothetical protein
MYSYQLRGTNGSGKTRVARHLIEVSNAQPCLHLGRKVRAYKGMLDDTPIFILGSYETQCGGCDTIGSVQEVADLLRLFMTNDNDLNCFQVSPEDGIVFFEGLMISHMLGTVGACQARLGKDKNILSFLDTPLDKCIEHVMTRRMMRKDERPFDPKNVVKDHPRVAQCRKNAIDQGYKVSDIHWKRAIESVVYDLKTIGGKLYRNAQ